MPPATYSVTLEDPPVDLLDRLAPVLRGQGSRTITARQDGQAYVFEGGASRVHADVPCR